MKILKFILAISQVLIISNYNRQARKLTMTSKFSNAQQTMSEQSFRYKLNLNKVTIFTSRESLNMGTAIGVGSSI